MSRQSALACRAVLGMVVLGLAGGVAAADEKPAPGSKPISVTLNLRGGKQLAGTLVSYDPDNLTVKTAKGEQKAAWSSAVSGEARLLMTRILLAEKGVDKLDPAGEVELGTWLLRANFDDSAEVVFTAAVKKDPSLADAVKQAKFLDKNPPTPTPAPSPTAAAPASQPTRTGRRGPTSRPAGADDPDGVTVIPMESILGRDDIDDLPPGLAMPKLDLKTGKFEFLRPSVEQQKLWVEYHKKKADEAIKKAGLQLTLLETEHNLIYTNWPPAEHKFLKDALEALFNQLATQFNIDDKSRHFLGKLPVFVVDTQAQFAKLSSRGFDSPVPLGVLGYCQFNSWGLVKLVLYRTEGYRGKSSLVRWGEVMSHEGSHAFLARYRSNARIDPWLNEGLAELISWQTTNGSDKWTEALRGARRVYYWGWPLRDGLFDSPVSPQAEFYPVAMSLCRMLLGNDARSKKAYVQMIADIKDGMNTEQALEKNYGGLDYEKLETMWRKWIVDPSLK